MAKDRDSRSRRAKPDAGAQGTDAGGSAGPGAGNRPSGRGAPGRMRRGRGAGPDPVLDLEAVAEDANEGEGLSGSGAGRSGSLPESVGGTTGVSGASAGITSPGASVPNFPGMSPEEFERLRAHGRTHGGDREEPGPDEASET